MSGRAVLALAASALTGCASTTLAQGDCGAPVTAVDGRPGTQGLSGCVAAPAGPAPKTAIRALPADLYCTPESGFAAGARGEAYAGICAGAAAQRFLAEHRKGERLFELETAARAAERAASDAATELWRVKRRIMQVETMRLSYSTPRDQRAQLYAEAKSLVAQKERYEAELDRLVAEKESADAALAAYRAEVAASLAAAEKAIAAKSASF